MSTLAVVVDKPPPFRLIAGVAVFLRTRGRAIVGTIRHVGLERDFEPPALELYPAAQVDALGRSLGEFLQLGASRQSDVEPFPLPVSVFFSAIDDVTPWPHEVPRAASNEDTRRMDARRADVAARARREP